MASYKTHSSNFLPIVIFLIFTILLSITQESFAGRQIPEDPKNDKKEPEWFIGHDGGSAVIPGIGQVTVPHYFSGSHGGLGGYRGGSNGLGGYTGGSNGLGGSTGGFNGRYIPGGDDTYVPNPGVEVPNPVGSGGGGVPGVRAAKP